MPEFKPNNDPVWVVCRNCHHSGPPDVLAKTDMTCRSCGTDLTKAYEDLVNAIKRTLKARKKKKPKKPAIIAVAA